MIQLKKSFETVVVLKVQILEYYFPLYLMANDFAISIKAIFIPRAAFKHSRVTFSTIEAKYNVT